MVRIQPARWLICALTCGELGVSHSAFAEWTVISLHPSPQISDSQADAIQGGTQIGQTLVNGQNRHAGMWLGSAGSWIDLHPPQYVRSEGYGGGDGQQVGITQTNEVHAALWSGSAASWVNLHPAGYIHSFAHDACGGQQVGYAILPNFNSHAGIWTGTADSWQSLHPASAWTSEAFGTDGKHQVGSVALAGIRRAGLWMGTPESYVDLHPTGVSPQFESRAIDIHNGEQVGSVGDIIGEGGPSFASLWRGSAESWINLNPPGHSYFKALGVHNGYQVGYGIYNNQFTAVIWQGGAESMQDLSVYLDNSWDHTYALDVWSDGRTQYVVGVGLRNSPPHRQALMWSRPLPICVADITGDGNVDVSDLLALINAWGDCPAPPDPCLGDINSDSAVDVTDLLAVINAWGDCP